ncbi:MAG: ferritin-like fold-containing protein [Gordonia sp. (in: high G+C Gram-positive bacteria)]
MPNDRDALVKLYEIFLAGEFAASYRLIDESSMAPTTADRVAIARLVAVDMANFESLAAHVSAAGVPLDEAIDRHIKVFNDFHHGTSPRTWLEVLVKIYIGDGLVSDFFSEVAAVLPDDAREALAAITTDSAAIDFARERVREAVDADPAVASPLTLWGRRLLGEAITHMQWVLAEDEDVTDLLFSGSASLAKAAEFFGAIAERHAQRMADLGLG